MSLEEFRCWCPSWCGAQADVVVLSLLHTLLAHASSPWLIRDQSWGSGGEKVEVMLDGVSFKEILFSWSQPSAGSCPSRVHVWFVDSLALTAKTGFLTDRMRDQVAAAAQLVGAGACLDTVAEAKTKPRRRQRLDSFTLQWKTLDDKTRCSVTLSCFFVFKELLFFRRCFQTAHFSVEDSGSAGQVTDETTTTAAAATTCAVYIPGEPTDECQALFVKDAVDKH